MLTEMEETAGLATEIFVNEMQETIRQRLGMSEVESAP
jgi:hypothetical protein